MKPLTGWLLQLLGTSGLPLSLRTLSFMLSTHGFSLRFPNGGSYSLTSANVKTRGFYLKGTLKSTALVRRDWTAAPQGTNIHDSHRRRCAPNENCRLQLKIAQTTRGSCAAQSWAEGIFAEEKHARNYYYHILTLSVMQLKGSHRRSSGFVSAPYTTKSRMLVKGNLPVQFTPGQNSKGAGVKDIIWNPALRSSKYCLFEVIRCVLGGTQQLPL